MSILEINNLSVEYIRNKKIIPALRGVSFKLEEGETLSVVGESGCGKSTLALAVLGLIFKDEGSIGSGKIIYYGNNLLDLSQKEWQNLRGDEISIVLQDPFTSLNPVLKIKEQLIETIEAHRSGLSFVDKTGLAIDALNEVMLLDHRRILDSYPHQLSGGQRQRIALAMAIINKPRILIADEPTTALDVTIQKEILELLNKLKNELSLTLVLITHNIPMASKNSDRMAVMYAGRIVELGLSRDMLQTPLHPYTQGLMRSIPKLLAASGINYVLPGQPPELSSLPQGCKFWPRCPKVMDICRIEEPEEYTVNNSKTRCYLYK
ncbi:MAG: ABC transporter ATP-binding protein [Elusimicrobia bacterium]|nr:ABC transporter ATP-binding protein [Candidatus Liberimonas magnetica]